MEDRFKDFSREPLLDIIQDFASNWLTHDGLWFLAVEKKYGLEAAIEMDTEAWRNFAPAEAKRIMKRHNIPPGGGLEALKKALGYRMYELLNKQEIVEETPNSFVFRMNECRVQAARKRKGLPDFPCRSVGLVEFPEFAKAIDPRIKVECVGCPPGEHPDNWWCAWRFKI
jgi:hypothetical protein